MTSSRTHTHAGTRARTRTRWWALGWLCAAAWALSFPWVSELATHRLWGWCAAAGYLGAACATRLRRPRAALVFALAGAVAVPLLYLAWTGQGQSEVTVIERSGRLLLESGSPYVDGPGRVEEYTPYLPGMALFGMPRAVLGDSGGLLRLLGDARIWCAAALLGGMWGGRRLLGAPDAGHRGLLPLLVASPVVALPLAVSGVDLPLAGLCCLALAAAATGRPVAAGAALAGACAVKWTAWPAVPVAVVLLAAVYGWWAAVRCGLIASAGTALAVLPAALLQPVELVRQVFAFPTGRADVPTPARSPLPGRLISELGPWGWWVTVALLLLGGAAVAVSLVLRPPRTVVAAADRLAVGLTVAFLLAPAGRFGYLALPVLLALWARSASPAPTAPPTSRVVASSAPSVRPRPFAADPSRQGPSRTGSSRTGSSRAVSTGG
ncbi:hypothetical protein [Streptomyces sp. NPDC101206]|uniref:hypothetical protein n=1 Tax=Streptomyces sp. NPDC101206 TaxID=3366128 RepID=UPI0037FF1232